MENNPAPLEGTPAPVAEAPPEPAPAPAAALDVDPTLADAINNVAKLLDGGNGTLSPEETQAIIEAARKVAEHRSPVKIACEVAFHQQGASYNVYDERVWETVDAIKSQHTAAKAARFGNTVLYVTHDGSSLMWAYVEEQGAREQLDVLRNEISRLDQQAMAVADGGDDPMGAVTPAPEDVQTITGFVAGEGPTHD